MWSVTYLSKAGEAEGEPLGLADHVAKRLAAMLAASPDAPLDGRQAAAFLGELPSKGRTPSARLVLPSGIHTVWAAGGSRPFIAHHRAYSLNVTRGERRGRSFAVPPRGQRYDKVIPLPLRSESTRKVWRTYVKSLNVA